MKSKIVVKLFFMSLASFVFCVAPAIICGQEHKSEAAFTVGVIAPLSGPLAEYGLASQNGIEQARQDHPELFKNLNFIFEDSQWDAKTAVSAFNSLRTKNKISLVYNWGNPTSEAIAPLAERYKIPLIALSVDPKISLNKNFVIRTTNEAAEFSRVLSKYLVNKNYKKLGIVLVENSYVKGLLEGLRSHLEPGQTIEIIDSYAYSEQEFRGSISKIRQANYDAVGVFLITGQISAFYRQLQDQKLKVDTFGTDFFESSNEITLAKGGMEGAVYPHLGVSETFRETYIQRYKNDYQIAYAGNAYDMAILLGTTFKQLNKAISAEELMSLLKNPISRDGICGKFHFANTEQAGPHYAYPVQLKIIKDGKIEKVQAGSASKSV